jgi:hypothetical protein
MLVGAQHMLPYENSDMKADRHSQRTTIVCIVASVHIRLLFTNLPVWWMVVLLQSIQPLKVAILYV